jgi:copper transport protein
VEAGQFGVESPAYVVLRATISAATMLVIGVFPMRFLVLTGARREREEIDALLPRMERDLLRWALAAGVVLAAATLARLVAQHIAIFGSGESPTTGTLEALVLRSGWGHAWLLALAGCAITLGALLRSRHDGRIRWAILAVGALLVVLSQPLSGHPAAAANPADAVAIQALHIVGAGGWVGTLATLILIAIPATAGPLPWSTATTRDEVVAALVRAFSPIALGSAAVLALSGALAAWRNLGGLAPLIGSPYGKVLLIKLSLLGITAGVGAYNWRRVLPKLGEPTATRRLGHSGRIELAAAVLVVLVTAVLVATPNEIP